MFEPGYAAPQIIYEAKKTFEIPVLTFVDTVRNRDRISVSQGYLEI